MAERSEGSRRPFTLCLRNSREPLSGRVVSPVHQATPDQELHDNVRGGEVHQPQEESYDHDMSLSLGLPGSRFPLVYSSAARDASAGWVSSRCRTAQVKDGYRLWS